VTADWIRSACRVVNDPIIAQAMRIDKVQHCSYKSTTIIKLMSEMAPTFT